MRYFIYGIILIGLLGCIRESQSPDTPPLAKDTLVAEPTYVALRRQIPYDSLKLISRQQRSQFAQQYQNAPRHEKAASLKAAGQWLRYHLTGQVFPAWYGTEWDFNGYTAKPREGKIACGYFVSTPLKQMGFNLNRYKMAQADATTISRSLSDTLMRFTDRDRLLGYIASQPDELYIVGLDNHVGFLYKSADTLDFIHSTFVTPSCVFREKAVESPVLSWSQVYVLAPLTRRKWTMEKWLSHAVFAVR